jgi:hypothetical protein
MKGGLMVVGGAQTITGALTWTHSIRKESKESPVSSLLSLPFFPCIFLDFLFVSVPEKEEEEEEEHTAASGVVVVRVRLVGVNI